MKHFAMYGASDDLIEFEGDFRDELNKEEDSFEIAGLEIAIQYEGTWAIMVCQIDEDIDVTAENLKLSVQPRMTGDGNGYSMRLDMDVPDEEMAAFEERVAKQLAAAAAE